MKVRIALDVDLANAALAALAMQAAHVARLVKDSVLDASHLKTANDQTAAFRKAVGNAELVTLD